MIQINLVPDIKQELLKAQRVRAGVISIAIITAIASAGVVIAFCIWVFGVQLGLGVHYDGVIKDKSQQISKVENLSDALTIQNQLAQLSAMHDSKNIDSRMFSLLETINPPAPNDIKTTTLSIDAETKVVKIEAQAAGGFPALETFRKTIEATTIEFDVDGQPESLPLAANLSDDQRSYGEDAEGNRVLRFTLTFTYPDQLFSRTAKNLNIVAPAKTNATDSFVGVPDQLFTSKANDTKEEGR